MSKINRNPKCIADKSEKGLIDFFVNGNQKIIMLTPLFLPILVPYLLCAFDLESFPIFLSLIISMTTFCCSMFAICLSLEKLTDRALAIYIAMILVSSAISFMLFVHDNDWYIEREKTAIYENQQFHGEGADSLDVNHKNDRNKMSDFFQGLMIGYSIK